MARPCGMYNIMHRSGPTVTRLLKHTAVRNHNSSVQQISAAGPARNSVHSYLHWIAHFQYSVQQFITLQCREMIMCV